MENFAPLLFLLFVSFVVSSISKALKSAGKGQTPQQKKAAQQPKANQAPASPRVKEAAPAPAPRVLQPTVRVTEHDDSVYQGSLNAVTGEGYDPCHEEQVAVLESAERREAPKAPQAVSGLPLGWTGSDIARGFVMGEILNRRRR